MMMYMDLNLESLKIPVGTLPGVTPPAQKTHRERKVRPGAFLKGPVPLDWLARAACLPGRALHVAIVACYLAGLRNEPTVKLSPSTLRLFGADRHAAGRALEALQDAGLLQVERHRGRAPVVTLIWSRTGDKSGP